MDAFDEAFERLTPEKLAEATGAKLPTARVWLPAIVSAMRCFDIATAPRVAAFLAQIGHESAGLSRARENLNYSPDGILKTFGKRFTPEQAQRYGRTAEHLADQHMIACIAYANRMGNGDVASGDGWSYRGGGPGQLTGRDNYRACSKALGIDIEVSPTLIERPDVGAMAFAWFWNENGLSKLADERAFAALSKRVNGGTNGLAERLALTDKNLNLLGVA